MFKNILWIDDLDNSDKKARRRVERFKTGIQNGARLSESDIEAIKHYFGEQLANFIKLEKRYCNALDLFNQNKLDYDLIVFDLNFDSDKEKIISTYKEICDKLNRGHIIPISKKPPHNIMEPDEFISVAGYYLYLFLAMKGFPTNRMVILTGNYSEGYHGQTPDIYLTMLDEAGNCYNDGWDIITKDVAQTCVNNNCDWLTRFYDKEKSHYYRIRRLIFHACAYWESRLSSDLKEKKDIPFNKVYFNNDKNDDERITSNNFIDMLEHIKMLFPVTTPACPEKVYYQAMKTLSMFHEESAKINNLNQKNLKRFHSCIRYFRNWSAHNKIVTSLDGEKFALLFCIALRTYFTWEKDDDLQYTSVNSDQKDISNKGLYTYEEQYDFEVEMTEPSKDIIREKMIDIYFEYIKTKAGETLELNEIFSSALKCDDKRKPKSPLDVDPNVALTAFGRESQDLNHYLFSSIWMPIEKLYTISIILSHDEKPIDVKANIGEENPETIRDLIQRADPSNCEGIFMRYCYRWFAGEET